MAELRRACSDHPELPQPVIIHLGTVEDGDRFLEEAWPEVQSIADADLDLRAALGVSRGRVGQLLGLASMAAGLRSMREGHKQTRPVGDPWMMPGAFLAQGDQALWAHEFRHAGDHPTTAALLAAVRSL
ncbi:MAG: AhpC/TSA family protein [Planctomycetes bacterium]|nr:AhpC/TSA family protein [Planctomycetota bacterium]